MELQQTTQAASSSHSTKLHRDRATLEAEITAIGSTIRGTTCHCPHPDHDDRNPSAGIYCDDAGDWRCKCHSCGWSGDVYDLRAALTGRPLAEVLREARGCNASTPPPRPRSTPPAKSERPRPTIDFAVIHAEGRRHLQPGELHDFTEAELGLSGEGVEALEPTLIDGRYAFPERDAKGQIIGLVRRDVSGGNKAVKGSRRGLTYRHPLPPSDPVLIVEGASDTAAAIEAGFNAVGRPSNRGGGELLAELLAGRAVVVFGENDQKADGRWPGREGVEAITERLRGVCKSLRSVYPPEGVKDLRAWLAEGGEA